MSEMINMTPPWPGMTRAEVSRHVAGGGRPQIKPQHAADVPNGLTELMEQCWAQDPTMRPTFVEIYDKIKQMRSNVGHGDHENNSAFDTSRQTRSETTRLVAHDDTPDHRMTDMEMYHSLP